MKSTDLQNFLTKQPKAAAISRRRTQAGQPGWHQRCKDLADDGVGRDGPGSATGSSERDGVKNEPLWHDRMAFRTAIENRHYFKDYELRCGASLRTPPQKKPNRSRHPRVKQAISRRVSVADKRIRLAAAQLSG